MKSQGSRFLSCIPAVRFGLQRPPCIPQNGGVSVSEDPGGNSGEIPAPSRGQLFVKEDTQVQTGQPTEISTTMIPEVVESDCTKPSEWRETEIPAHVAKVIVLSDARFARLRRRRPREAKRPAVIIPFPQRARRPPTHACFKPHAPQVVTTQQALPCRPVTEEVNGDHTIGTSFPRRGEAHSPAGMKIRRIYHREGQRSMQGDPGAPGQPNYRHKRKRKKRRTEVLDREPYARAWVNQGRININGEIVPRSPPLSPCHDDSTIPGGRTVRPKAAPQDRPEDLGQASSLVFEKNHLSKKAAAHGEHTQRFPTLRTFRIRCPLLTRKGG